MSGRVKRRHGLRAGAQTKGELTVDTLNGASDPARQASTLPNRGWQSHFPGLLNIR